MRLIITSDWHLGRMLHGVHLTGDQAHALDQLIALARDAGPDAILIAGDIFDRAVPPAEAVELLDDVLSRLVLELGIPVVIIAGNHDNPVRLGFGSSMLARAGLHVFGGIRPEAGPLVLEGKGGRAAIYALSYAEPSMVREKLGDGQALDHNAAMAARIKAIGGRDSNHEVSIVMAHAFVDGGAESESERPLSIGGVGTVEARLFSGFDFVALGHLHRPQSCLEGRVHYPGSLLKYSFSESNDHKSFTLLEIDGQNFKTERIPIIPKRDLRRKEGFLKDLLQGPDSGENREDYLLVTLLDQGAVFDAMGRLREVYPNVLHLDRSFLRPEKQDSSPANHKRRPDDLDLFVSFYSQTIGVPLTVEQERVFREIAEVWRRAERES